MEVMIRARVEVMMIRVRIKVGVRARRVRAAHLGPRELVQYVVVVPLGVDHEERERSGQRAAVHLPYMHVCTYACTHA